MPDLLRRAVQPTSSGGTAQLWAGTKAPSPTENMNCTPDLAAQLSTQLLTRRQGSRDVLHVAALRRTTCPAARRRFFPETRVPVGALRGQVLCLRRVTYDSLESGDRMRTDTLVPQRDGIASALESCGTRRGKCRGFSIIGDTSQRSTVHISYERPV